GSAPRGDARQEYDRRSSREGARPADSQLREAPMAQRARTRRELLGDVARGALLAGLGAKLVGEWGLVPAFAEDAPAALSFGRLEPLVALLQETPIDRLLPVLVEKLRGGTDLRTLVAAGALANARTFGGEDYVGFHSMM